MRFIIDRATWRNGGHGTGQVFLENEEGYKCCLGFVCEQSGVKNICNKLNPMTLFGKDKIKVPFLMMQDCMTFLCSEAILINDDVYLSDEERENKLYQLFIQHDIEIEFQGQYV